VNAVAPEGTGAGLGNKIDGTTPIGSGAPAQNTTGVNYFTGRSDNFALGQTSGNPNNARLDPESIRVSQDGKSVFISDEYGPYINQFDRATGQRIKSFALPANLDISNLSPLGNTEINGNATGRVANKGMEGLAITPDGKTLVGIMQAPLEQDAAAAPNLLRIVTVDIATGTTHEYGYLLTKGSGASDIVAINDHQFLVDERDGKGLGDGTTAKNKLLYQIDLTGAQDITGLTGAVAAAKAVNSTKVADLVSILGTNGIAPNQVPAKIEGLAFGQDVTYNSLNYHTLFVTNDNDFLSAVAGPNTFYVLGLTDADFAPGTTFVAQDIPEPASLTVAAVGIIGLGLLRRRRNRPA
jgi:hypothetical protein